ncbi:MAG: hypothetical protein ACHQVS_03210 [Candidatus Babeliales bacterium]
MKRILPTIFCSLCLIFIIPVHSSQLTLQDNIPHSGTRADYTADINVNGTVHAPLTVHLPSETQTALIRIAGTITCFGYGIGSCSMGITELIGTNKKPSPSAVEALEEGLRRRKTEAIAASIQATHASSSTPLLTYEDDEEEPRKSCCSRLTSSRGVRHIAAGLWFIGFGLGLELIPHMFKK